MSEFTYGEENGTGAELMLEPGELAEKQLSVLNQRVEDAINWGQVQDRRNAPEDDLSCLGQVTREILDQTLRDPYVYEQTKEKGGLKGVSEWAQKRLTGIQNRNKFKKGERLGIFDRPIAEHAIPGSIEKVDTINGFIDPILSATEAYRTRGDADRILGLITLDLNSVIGAADSYPSRAQYEANKALREKAIKLIKSRKGIDKAINTGG